MFSYTNPKGWLDVLIKAQYSAVLQAYKDKFMAIRQVLLWQVL